DEVTNEASSNVVHATGCKWEKDAHWPHRIGLRPRNARRHRQRGSAGGQVQKLSAGKFHFEPPSLTSSSIISPARQVMALCVRADPQAHGKHPAPTPLARHRHVAAPPARAPSG